MQIRPLQFTNDPRGAPAVEYEYHIGTAFNDPTIDENKLTVKDGINGSDTSNPFFINSVGLFQNKAGQQISPWIDESEYAVTVLSPSGGLRYADPNFTSDIVSATGRQDTVVDQVFNNFTITLTADLSPYDTIYVESFAAGWEDTVNGPIDGFYAHADGTTGTPSTGTPAAFFDSGGNGWREDDSQRIGDSDVTTIRIADSAVTGIKIDPAVAANGLSKDGSDNLQVNVDSSTIEIDTDILRVKDDGITADKINANVAGLGLSQNISGALDVNVDDSTIELVTDTLQVKDDGITAAKINSDIAGLGLSQAVGGELDVNVDDSSIEINSDTLRVKALGITEAMLNALLAAKINQGNAFDTYRGSVTNNGSTAAFVGTSPSGWTVTRLTTPIRVRITHSLNTLDYSCIPVSLELSSTNDVAFNIETKAVNSVDIVFQNINDSAIVDADFDFILVEN